MLDRYDQDLLLDYLEGELDADRRAQLESMLNEDSQLATLLAQMSADREALRALPREEVPGDLTHDLMQNLERRMLLDEPVNDGGPIPLARGRALPGEPEGRNRWGRIAGLTGLAASVAVAAGVVVITLSEDPLTHTANELASAQGDAEESFADAGAASAEEAEAEASDGNALSTDGTTRERTAEREANLPPAPAEDNADGAFAFEGGGNAGNVAEGFAADAATDAQRIARSGADQRPDRPANPTKPTGPATLDTQPTIALALTRPSRQLVVYSDQPDIAREQVVQFAITNGIAIVETDDEAINDAYRQAEPQKNASKLAGDDNPRLASNYALLLDQTQLDVLITGLNNNDAPTLVEQQVQADPQPQFTFANQAAVVSHLPKFRAKANLEQRVQDGRNNADEPADANNKGASALPDALEPPLPKEPAETAAQTVVIRLPQDLGSPDANSLNYRNFSVNKNKAQAQAEQNNNYNNTAGAKQADATPPPATEAPRQAIPVEPKPEPKPAAEPAVGAELANAETDAVKEQQPGAATQSDRALEETERRKDLLDAGDKTLDPTRYNWLTPYLPQAQTTPILRWAMQADETSPELIPLIIERAPTGTVNALRIREQLKYAERQNELADTDARDAKADQASEAEVVADEAGPADAAERDSAGVDTPKPENKSETPPDAPSPEQPAEPSAGEN